eukprot:CAMPEP_0117449382 /NCGR_PEP_ID=MMETSP0759-20121206/7916_1 /TAXON_ID=63605 /ORGANISM="Percolomonas cosmopolitus, Strain WS" /LENGTH=399 /DNA_ID=CAMNT_0005241855 /DNA_START=160 /DNA_END=1356 /DNA_ORIENTATION=-
MLFRGCAAASLSCRQRRSYAFLPFSKENLDSQIEQETFENLLMKRKQESHLEEESPHSGTRLVLSLDINSHCTGFSVMNYHTKEILECGALDMDSEMDQREYGKMMRQFVGDVRRRYGRSATKIGETYPPVHEEEEYDEEDHADDDFVLSTEKSDDRYALRMKSKDKIDLKFPSTRAVSLDDTPQDTETSSANASSPSPVVSIAHSTTRASTLTQPIHWQIYIESFLQKYRRMGKNDVVHRLVALNCVAAYEAAQQLDSEPLLFSYRTAKSFFRFGRASSGKVMRRRIFNYLKPLLPESFETITTQKKQLFASANFDITDSVLIAFYGRAMVRLRNRLHDDELFHSFLSTEYFVGPKHKARIAGIRRSFEFDKKMPLEDMLERDDVQDYLRFKFEMHLK